MNNKKRYKYWQSGFTAVEFLMTIIIVIILFSVIIVFINKARNRGNDTTIKSGLNQTRIQADIFYNNSGVYTGLCDVSQDSTDPKGINAMIYTSGKANNFTSPINVNGMGTSSVRCNANADGWAAEIPLKSEKGYYCVDYTKKGIVTTNSIGGTYAFCR